MSTESQPNVRLGLSGNADLINRETQMVLPAVLLLFVFQAGILVNETFNQKMSWSDHVVALVSLFGLAVGAAGLLTPSIYGRTEPRQVSKRTLVVARWAGRAPLAFLAVKFAADV